MKFNKIISVLLCLSMLFTMSFGVYAEDDIMVSENENVVSNCEVCGLSEGHLDDCTQIERMDNEEILCTCNLEVHSEDCPFYVGEEPDIVIEEDIGFTLTFDYLMSLTLFEELYGLLELTNHNDFFISLSDEEKVELSEFINGLYADLEMPTDEDTELKNSLIDLLVVEIEEDRPIICENCGLENGEHLEDCPDFEVDEEIDEEIENTEEVGEDSNSTEDMEDQEITPSDPVYSVSPDTETIPVVLTAFERLCNSENLIEFYEILLDMEYYEDILNLTSDEIEELKLVVEDLYNPEEDDIELKEEILETLDILPNAETKVENPVQTLDYLEWSGTVEGLTLNKDVVLVGDTYMTSIISIPKNTAVTIDLNGYMLHGSGSGAIIDNQGKLTIIDSRPNSGVHRFRKVSDGPWVLDEYGDYTVVGGIITGGRDETAINASSSGGGAIKQGSNNRSNVLTINGGTFIGNSSTRAGGAIYGGAVTMNGGLIIGNYAESFGAGISLSGSFTMNGGEIRENNTNPKSSYNKAGTKSYDCASVIIGYSSDFLMTGGKLVGTLSTVKTDAVDTTFTMTGGEVIGDFRILNGLDATLSGGTINGSVYMLAGNCTVSGSQLIYGGNRDNGGSLYISGGNFTMEGGTIKDSSATNGGAVYITGGNFDMYNGTIKNCYSENNGGGIYLSGGNINIYNGRIINNEADNNGGGIYVDTKSVDVIINVYDGEISNNTAGNHAGAIGANADGGCSITLNIGEELCLGENKSYHDDNSCPEIYDNTALRFGGAFCLHGDADKLNVNIYCGNIENNNAIRNYGSNTLKQNGGSVIVYGGAIDAGIMVGGGSYTDTRIDAEQVYFNLWSNYDGGPAEATVIDVTRGVTFVFPSDTYEWEGHVLSGWSNQADTKGLYIPVQGEYVVDNATSEYLDFYAVWDAQTSYVVYIPAELTINENTYMGEFELQADINYFKKDSVLNVYIDSDFVLEGIEAGQILPYTLTLNEGGILTELESGDIVASYKYNYRDSKHFIIELQGFPKKNDRYLGSVTFTIDYDEVNEDYTSYRL